MDEQSVEFREWIDDRLRQIIREELTTRVVSISPPKITLNYDADRFKGALDDLTTEIRKRFGSVA